MSHTEQHNGYAVVVQRAADRWSWAINDVDANIAASGEAADRETAWRTGVVAADVIGRLQRARRRAV
ncbi:hypothetical protein [Caulobacter mirabilis]|uniref:DUF1508 domain-containing protein n=1 Tax=Caulobacter mirabilis TaxID=69666 RepID=A0A2D2AYW6_9CAUL|nr:hypothetical protein [Caulobacter mirabilis]ATQ43200.1 hypothetical protein CSW64_12630 [Caulobacter mirabilis]